ncbi:MAG: 2-hydroxychromene-2-carboxylate isomerase [Rhizorhabdus sp.]
MKTVHYYFDFMSPYAYLACSQIPRLVDTYRGVAEFEGHPFNMWEARIAAGNTGPSNRDMPARSRVLMADVARWSQRYGIPVRPPKGFDTERLNRGFLVAKDKGDPVAYLASVNHSLWGTGGDPQDEALLAEGANKAGIAPDEMIALVDSPEIIARYADENKKAQENGIFGAPMFIVDDQVYWGNDRLEWVEEYLRETSPIAKTAR